MLLYVAAILTFLLGGAVAMRAIAAFRLLGLAEELHGGDPGPAEVGVGVWATVLGASLLGGALGLRSERLWGWRLSVAALAGVVADAFVQRTLLGLLMATVAALALWLVLLRESREIVNRTPDERALAAEEDRSIQRAQRRLTPDEPTLRGISLVERPPERRDETN